MSPDRSDVALGIDIGGTRVRVGVVASAGRILARADSPTPAAGDPQALGRLVRHHAGQVIAAAGAEPTATGVALPGIWERGTGVMQRAVNLPRLEGINIRRLFEQALGGAIFLDSDVNAAAWAQWQSMSPPPKRLVYLSLGTGVGGSAILDGEIVRHTHGGAGHFGLLIVDSAEDAPAGRIGVPGCLEAVLRKNLEANEPSNRRSSLPADNLAQAARGLAVACAQLVHLYAPDVIILGGGVVDHHPGIVTHTRQAFARYQSGLIPAGMRIVGARLSTEEAGVIGAALLALRAGNARSG